MNVRLPWGSDALDLRVPDSWNVVFPKATAAPQTSGQDEVVIVRQALDQPAESAPIRELDLQNKAILIIVDDITRPTPAHRFFHLVLDDLQRAGANADQITVMPALGIHTPMTEAEMAAKIGPHNLARVHWHNHNAFDVTVEEEFLLYYSLQLIRQYDLYLYVPSLTAEEVRRLGFFRHFGTPQAVIDQACRKLTPKPTVAVFPEAGATFPIVEIH